MTFVVIAKFRQVHWTRIFIQIKKHFILLIKMREQNETSIVTDEAFDMIAEYNNKILILILLLVLSLKRLLIFVTYKDHNIKINKIHQLY